MENKRKIGNSIITAIISFAIVITFLTIITMGVIALRTNKESKEISGFMNYKPVICVSNSMENEFKVGDIVINKAVNVNELKVGDVIAYRENEYIVIHRIQNIINENGKKVFITKGDMNNTEDERTIEYSQIEGKYINKIPYVGNIILKLQDPKGFVAVFFIPIMLLICFYKIKLNRSELKTLRRKKLLKRLQEKKVSSENIL